MSDPLKKFKPFLQRADELEAHQPIISFYCRVFVSEGLMKAKQAGNTDPGLVEMLLASLDGAEKLKKVIDLESGPQKFEEFSLLVFKAADDADRAGNADNSLAMRFYAASLFLEANEQFHNGELPPDLVEKRRYARYKTAYIRDCVKKGIKPEPGPPGGDPGQEETAPPAATSAQEPSSNPLPPPSVVTPAADQSAASGYASQTSPPAAQPSAPPAPPQPPGAPAPTRKRMMEAKRKAEHAASALEFDDVPTARRLLKEALQELES
eukprot:gnl/MRDRNA2_/MRDRNA2_167093_c0_seq1.p1 gnl/MRDRNA2_/MRDRNA2_167093_c0~~gnl/MRDRNA2_/MRDRNA2_167093_c0_seq1.p1  ORF type:complete len:266 (-),score=80.12 gnl/MRDRNA2_/MRDRNA2_167093_c0_seq1:70-867(-)